MTALCTSLSKFLKAVFSCMICDDYWILMRPQLSILQCTGTWLRPNKFSDSFVIQFGKNTLSPLILTEVTEKCKTNVFEL